jgi:hypothetical protein
MAWPRNVFRLSITLVSVSVFSSSLQAQQCTEICESIDEGGGQPVNYCAYPQTGCPPNLSPYDGCCCLVSPILIDAYGEGFHLTSLHNGVTFRILPSGGPYQISWTDPEWRNGWLVLDRNGNGMIDDLTELFGNFTAQPLSDHRNGFLALAVFDDVSNGGNGNGEIDPGDAVYDHLKIWIDANHNGISEKEELHSLREMGIFRIDLKYHLSRYVDENGNTFRYRGRIWDEAGRAHEMCYDVFLVAESQESK